MEQQEKQDRKKLPAAHARALKLALDAVMLILLVLMYRKQAISLAFHEIGGLALIGLFVVHHLVNARWIGAATRRLFAKGTPGLVRARYIVDALLLVSFLAVGITGVLISKVVFSFHIQGNIQSLHYFSSALAIVLMGVHLGLHADYMFGKLLRRGGNKIAKVALSVVLAAMMIFGGYCLFTTQFVSYLTAPLQAARFSHGTFAPSGDIALDGSGERPSDLSELPELVGEGGMQPPQGGGNGGFGGAQGQDQGTDSSGPEGRESGSGGVALLIAQYASIIALFGAVTYGVVRLVGRRKKPVIEDARNEIPSAAED